MVARAKAIAMGDVQLLARKLKPFWPKVYGYVQLFLKVCFHPHVVVAHKKMDGNAFVGKIGEFAQEPHIAFGHHVFVFVPKIKQVANNKYDGSFVFNLIEKSNEFVFPLAAGSSIGCAQMKIRKKENLFAGG